MGVLGEKAKSRRECHMSREAVASGEEEKRRLCLHVAPEAH